MKRKTKITGSIVVAICVLGIIAYTIPPVRHSIRTAVTTITARLSSEANAPFPTIHTAGLSAQQVRIINIARTEYAKHPISYDQTVLQYTQSVKEAWCADFVSWVMEQSHNVYRNPNSGNWRIPGVYTLQEYYQAQGRYATANEYQPKPGDVAFYIGKHTFGLLSTGHVALVIQVSGKQMTTIGGNESGRLRLDTQSITAGDHSLVGFGKL